ncbi:hypothetical protein BpHYR1_005436 [Brachionus plicatilis]|uniref:Uncharacterized protein n=1 Tax=Brachionus plicatilis TaxID=10195 RepID=A0A3M7Q328_BRAPC|nr:hypothetical protein BpHYR1_005436 [Brachionus plicatilis]
MLLTYYVVVQHSQLDHRSLIIDLNVSTSCNLFSTSLTFFFGGLPRFLFSVCFDVVACVDVDAWVDVVACVDVDAWVDVVACVDVDAWVDVVACVDVDA